MAKMAEKIGFMAIKSEGDPLADNNCGLFVGIICTNHVQSLIKSGHGHIKAFPC